jgi:hypothetical protein
MHEDKARLLSGILTCWKNNSLLVSMISCLMAVGKLSEKILKYSIPVH